MRIARNHHPGLYYVDRVGEVRAWSHVSTNNSRYRTVPSVFENSELVVFAGLAETPGSTELVDRHLQGRERHFSPAEANESGVKTWSPKPTSDASRQIDVFKCGRNLVIETDLNLLFHYFERIPSKRILPHHYR